jgi:hypothetical protein
MKREAKASSTPAKRSGGRPTPTATTTDGHTRLLLRANRQISAGRYTLTVTQRTCNRRVIDRWRLTLE